MNKFLLRKVVSPQNKNKTVILIEAKNLFNLLIAFGKRSFAALRMTKVIVFCNGRFSGPLSATGINMPQSAVPFENRSD